MIASVGLLGRGNFQKLDKVAEEFKMARRSKGHGGRRDGAGRPRGSRMRRSEALAEELITNGKCPVLALVRLAEQCEAQGDTKEAIGAWKSLLPYVYPEPKAVEVDPEQVVALARDLAAVRVEASVPDLNLSHVELLEQAMAEMEGCHED